MNIAIATTADRVSGHFGHSESFTIFEIAEGKVVRSRILPAPVHEHGSLPAFLYGNGIDTVISGGMGAGAVERFEAYGIAVVTGATGTVEEACKAFLSGRLVNRGATCDGHQHHDGACGHSHP